LTVVLLIERIATRYHLPPHEVAGYDADFYLRHLAIIHEAEGT
jgi:hypothetical protein